MSIHLATTPLGSIKLAGLAFRTPHDIAWDSLDAGDAAAVREALITADRLRKSTVHDDWFGIDPGRSYLEAFAAQKAVQSCN